MPTQVSKGRKSPRLDLASTHEEADILITQQAIHLAKEDPESHVRVVCDDTDVFALLAYHYLSEKLQSSLTMQSPIIGRSCIDVKETARKHSAIVPELLALHALTGCDSVAATYGLGKQKQSLWLEKATLWISLVNPWQISLKSPNKQQLSWVRAMALQLPPLR
ncbi:hypothetical protein GWK47_051785 [Chionoecetes opilio]|uniref:Uncharacterized protein n=1 Tax=Chionoecetes opilio TaxID=41210 RepID=A0A8J4Y1W4_CHIOP|nr:hypothetical protein GWK47_051785 [Chionoecetes opilio]